MKLNPHLVVAALAIGALVGGPARADSARAGRPGDVATPAIALVGSIAGVVLGPSGNGLAGICVIVAATAGPRLAVTSAGGQYAVAGLPPGRYRAGFRSCRRPGQYERHAAGSVQVAAGQPTLLRPVTLRLADPRAERAARLAAFRQVMVRSAALRRPPTLSGTVESAAGKALSGMCVRIVPVAYADQGDLIATDKNGRYRVPNGSLPLGRYRVAFSTGCGSDANYAPQWWRHAPTLKRATILRVGKHSHFTGIDARLVAGGSISGVVRGGRRSGPGLSDVCVEAAGTGQGNPAFNPYEATYTGKGGRYRLTGLAAGRYQVQFDPTCLGDYSYLAANYPRKVLVTPRQARTGVDIVLPEASSISGTVTSQTTGRPVAGICVFAIGGGVDNIGLAASNSRGRYTADGLAAATFAVEFLGGLCGNSGSYASQFYDDELIPVPDVHVGTAQAVTGIDARMRPGGTVMGRVTSSSGKPISGACVTATSQQNWSGGGQTPIGLDFGSLTLVTTPGVTSRRDGSYREPNLNPGLYNVNFSGCGQSQYAAQWFHPGGGPGPAWLSVVGGRPVVANLALPLPGSISGVIKSPAGRPLANICPETFGLDGQVPYLYAINPAFASPVSNQSGHYKLTGLGGGRYAIEFLPCSGKAADAGAATWYPNAATEAGSVKVTVRDGRDTSGIDAVMAAGQIVTGKVTVAATGRPVATECVEVLSVPGDLPRNVVTNREGVYALRLRPGRHTIAVFQCDSRAPLGQVRSTFLVRRNSARTVVNVALPRQGAITGTLRVGPPAAAAAGACVEAFPVSGSGIGGLEESGPHGGYFLTGLAPGRYQVRFTSACLFATGEFAAQWFSGQPSRAGATLVQVGPGGTARGVGATLAADGGIAGQVRAFGKAVAGVCAIAFPAAGSGAPVAAETSADGGYLIEDLTPGRYKVEFTAGCGGRRYRSQWYKGAHDAAAAKPVTVRPGLVTARIDAS